MRKYLLEKRLRGAYTRFSIENSYRLPVSVACFRGADPTAIDREQRMSALRYIVGEGRKRLESGIWVTLFPEGTRIPSGEVGRFQRGGAMLAKQSGVPTYFVAHNGGDYWRYKSFIKRPGVIQLRVSPPQAVGDRTSQEFNSDAETWMREQMVELDACAVE